MSAHTHRKAQRKYKQRISSERASNQPSISTAMSVAERVRRLRERRKVDAVHTANDCACTSPAAIAELMEKDHTTNSKKHKKGHREGQRTSRKEKELMNCKQEDGEHDYVRRVGTNLQAYSEPEHVLEAIQQVHMEPEVMLKVEPYSDEEEPEAYSEREHVLEAIQQVHMESEVMLKVEPCSDEENPEAYSEPEHVLEAIQQVHMESEVMLKVEPCSDEENPEI